MSAASETKHHGPGMFRAAEIQSVSLAEPACMVRCSVSEKNLRRNSMASGRSISSQCAVWLSRRS